MKRALVTGGTGYIGRALLRRLAESGVDTTAIVRPTSDRRLAAPARVIVDTGDVAYLAAGVQESEPDVIFHLAAHTAVANALSSVDPLVTSNILFGTRLLEAASGRGRIRFVNTASYWQHADGSPQYAPNTLYAATKQAFQDILTFYVNRRDVAALTLRLSDVYGPNDPRRKLLPQLVDAQAKGQVLKLSPGHQRIDLVHVDDVVSALIFAAELLARKPELSGNAYSVASGRLRSIREVVACVERVSGKPVAVEWGGIPFRPGEVMHPYLGDPLPGWHPSVDFDDALGEMLTTVEHPELWRRTERS